MWAAAGRPRARGPMGKGAAPAVRAMRTRRAGRCNRKAGAAGPLARLGRGLAPGQPAAANASFFLDAAAFRAHAGRKRPGWGVQYLQDYLRRINMGHPTRPKPEPDDRDRPE